jgi:DNA-binding MarR family transcriptional regulator
MSVRSRSKQAAVDEVWRLLLQCALSQFGRTAGILQQLGLTPGHMKALLMLDPDEPRPMGFLAQRFQCDASTMTWLVDRLEERGLVERRGLQSDRRVKTVALTPLGVQTKSDLERRLYDPPKELLALDRNTLEELREVLRKLAAESGPPTGWRRGATA